LIAKEMRQEMRKEDAQRDEAQRCRALVSLTKRDKI
jgi:hypothetical protein